MEIKIRDYYKTHDVIIKLNDEEINLKRCSSYEIKRDTEKSPLKLILTYEIDEADVKIKKVNQE